MCKLNPKFYQICVTVFVRITWIIGIRRCKIITCGRCGSIVCIFRSFLGMNFNDNKSVSIVRKRVDVLRVCRWDEKVCRWWESVSMVRKRVDGGKMCRWWEIVCRWWESVSMAKESVSMVRKRVDGMGKCVDGEKACRWWKSVSMVWESVSMFVSMKIHVYHQCLYWCRQCPYISSKARVVFLGTQELCGWRRK